MVDYKDTLSSLAQELRRGTVVIGVLSQLSSPQYGYSLVSLLEEKGFHIDAGTLYPLLRRLEKQGVLDSKWDTNESRPRKYYLLSEAGKKIYEELCQEWMMLSSSIGNLIHEHSGESEGEGKGEDEGEGGQFE